VRNQDGTECVPILVVTIRKTWSKCRLEVKKSIQAVKTILKNSRSITTVVGKIDFKSYTGSQQEGGSY
jgi:hypothetical protein